jgi:hypothetical protein
MFKINSEMEKSTFSPMDYAEDCVVVVLPDVDYNERTQVRFDFLTTHMAVTHNATCTYDPWGKPTDNDNDQ